MEDLKSYFHIERLDEAVNDTFEDAEALQELVLEVPYTELLDELLCCCTNDLQILTLI